MEYVTEIRRIDHEVKRLTKRVKDLRAFKKAAQARLAGYMKKRRLAELSGFTLGQLEPPPRPRRKGIKEQRRDVAFLLTRHGVSDPEGLVREIEHARRGH